MANGLTPNGQRVIGMHEVLAALDDVERQRLQDSMSSSTRKARDLARNLIARARMRVYASRMDDADRAARNALRRARRNGRAI